MKAPWVLLALVALLGAQAAGMCQCGIFVLWENNRVGEEILLGDPMSGRCRSTQATNGRLEGRCKAYCSTRSELLTSGGNLAVMGTFLSMATKFYACQMLHSFHQDPNGHHLHLGQPRVNAFWVGSFYRYCQHDWKFAGRESIRQVCCERGDFILCPTGVRNDNPPDFKLADPPKTSAPEVRTVPPTSTELPAAPANAMTAPLGI
ncbi:unnamed protein product [Notodromas monacha]|uniref:Uncharacterized protein n=1 Tax=Notodromas monacha TaxID=399045 RepID=A0A7R9GEI5_9CRUS|nr:unnamed protein product [Notodromas monacha]CAG0918096.1 unnamed protein product [Notodromas monacha]